MKLKDIVKQSTFSIIATVTGQESLSKAELFLGYNLELYSMFDNLLLSFNSSAESFNQQYIDLYKNYLPNISIAYTPVNNFHMFGTIDLDEECLRRCQTEFLWKANDDVLLGPKLLEKELDTPLKDFFYLPSFSYESLQALKEAKAYDSTATLRQIPQTTFFILRRYAVSSLYGDDVEWKREQYLAVKEVNPNVKPWDMQFADGLKFGLEDHLDRATKVLNRQCLLNEKSFNSLVEHVRENREGDPSHKNIMLTELDICHYHYYKNNEPVYIV